MYFAFLVVQCYNYITQYNFLRLAATSGGTDVSRTIYVIVIRELGASNSVTAKASDSIIV
jgi:hypothetical protein